MLKADISNVTNLTNEIFVNIQGLGQFFLNTKNVLLKILISVIIWALCGKIMRVNLYLFSLIGVIEGNIM